jgi:putative tricarboxylic transport membrane protein
MKAPTVAAIVAAAFAASACSATPGGGSGDVSADNWPHQPIKVIFPSSPGGGLDGNINQFLPFLGKALGAKFEVEYRDGADQAVGLTLATRAAGDCNTLVGLNNPTGTLFSWLSQKNIHYTNKDFRSLGSLVSDPTTWSVRKNSKYKTLKDLVADAKERPGEVKISISHLYSNYAVAVYQLEEATGAKFNLVAFDGGGPARTAVISGEVDATVDSVYAGLSSRDQTRVLGVQNQTNEWKSLTNDAPTVNEVLGVQVSENSYQHTVAAPASCAEKAPERFKKLVAAFDKARESADYEAVLEKNDEQDKILRPMQSGSEFDAMVAGDRSTIEGLIKQYPALGGAS